MELYEVARLYLLAGCVSFGLTSELLKIIAKVNGDIALRRDRKDSPDMEEALRQQAAPARRCNRRSPDREKDILRDRIDQLLLVKR